MPSRSILYIAFSALLGVPFMAHAAAPEWVEPMQKVHAKFAGQQHYVAQLGDSITYSMAFWSPLGWDNPEKYLPANDGWPQLPKDRRWRDVILGVRDKGGEHGNDSGWRVENILAVQAKVLKEKRPEVAIIMIGTNDVHDNHAPEGYADGLAKVVDNCLTAHCVPLITTIPPMRGHDQGVGEVNAIIKKVAAAKKIPLIDYYAAIMERRPGKTWDRSLISEDGSHPSASKTNIYSEENLKNDGYALRNWVTFLKYREVYFQVLHPEEVK